MSIENGNGDLNAEVLSDEELEDVETVEKDAYINQRTRAEKSEAENKTLKEELEEVKEAGKEKDPEKKKDDKKDAEKEEGLSFSDVMQISAETKDLTSEEMELLNLEAQKLGVKPEKFIKSDTWKAYLTTQRATEAEKNKTPNASARVVVHDNKTFNEIMSNPEVSKDDQQKGFEGVMEKYKGKG